MAPENATDIIDLQVTATELGDWLGITAVAENGYARTGVLPRHNNLFVLKDSIRAYAEHIRVTAAGRGGTSQATPHA